ncbi:MAG: hypothetical protein DCC71_10900 [Proteobacteria bacterium]|nr:MAG: hypothetical protein DCC71_10900 [Pseudomonadota bacterium]
MRRVAGVALAALLALVPAAGFAAGESPAADAAAELAPECPPFEAGPVAPGAPVRDPGIAPSRRGAPSGDPAFVSLADARDDGAAAVPGEALLALPKLADGRVASDFQLAPGARIASSYFSPILCSRVVRVVGPAGVPPDALVRRVPAGGAVVRNDVYRTAAPELRPIGAGEDPYRALQYGLDRAGVEAARAVADGAGARVALLDSAADAAHRDLARVRSAPLAGGPAATPAAHGSMLAGIVGALAGNDFGIAGLAPGAELISIAACTPDPAGAGDACALADLLRGVDRAWEEKAQVVNLSLVGPPNPLLRRAMDRLDQLGVLLVAAVGNEATDVPRYPAAYPSVIGVGAIDRDGAPYARGNRGESVEVLAPGVEIVSSVPGDRFAFGDGTSLAAAHVAGMLAVAVAASGDPLAARTAFFQVAQEGGGSLPVRAPALCPVLAKLGKPCPTR